MATILDRSWINLLKGNSGLKRLLTADSLAVLLALAYAIYFSIFTVARHRAFMTQSFDLSVYVQMLWNSLNGDFLRVTIQPGRMNYLQHHFAPSMLLFIPLYGIWRSPESLLAIQSFVLASGAWPIYKLASMDSSNKLRGLVFALVYLLYPALQGANLYDFHEITIAAPLLAWILYFARFRQWPGFWIASILAMGFREEVVIFTIGIGCLLVFKSETRRVGISLILVSLFWLVVLINVSFFQTNFDMNADLYFQQRFGIGTNPLEAFWKILIHPGGTVNKAFTPPKLMYLFSLLTPAGFLPLFTWEAMLLVFPFVGLNLLGDYPLLISPSQAQYNVLLVPMIVITAEIGTSRLQNFLSNRSKFNPRTWNTALCLFLLLLSIGYQFRLAHLPISPYFKWPQITERNRYADVIARTIPVQASLSIQDNLAPHASHRRDLYIFPEIHRSQYIFLDLVVVENLEKAGVIDLKPQINSVLASGAYETVLNQDGFLLLRRKESEKE